MLLLLACTSGVEPTDSATPDTGDTAFVSPDAFADAVVSFEPGDFAGYGQDRLPDVVLGSPDGKGPDQGSLDVLSLGHGGFIVLELTDLIAVDGEGPDLLIFENPFTGFYETGSVAVSEDGETWAEWPCDPETTEGCAGVNPVLASSTNGVDPTDPETAGGEAYDLADVGLSPARFVRITDTGTNDYGGNTGGFDLDAIAVVNAQER